MKLKVVQVYCFQRQVVCVKLSQLHLIVWADDFKVEHTYPEQVSIGKNYGGGMLKAGIVVES